MRAYIETNHKGELFKDGFRVLKYDVSGWNGKPDKGDVLVVWNINKQNRSIVGEAKNKGCTILVAENGYIGSDDNGNRLIALAKDNHAGLGRWNIGTEKRYLKHNFTIKDWRVSGDEIIILAQRGIGCATDIEWAYKIAKELKTDKKIIIREHPAKKHRENPVEQALDNAYCAVTWSSGAGIKAIAYGVPVMYCMEGWIGGKAASRDLHNLYKGDREPMFHALGWAQWTQREISTGEALEVLLCE